MRDGGKRDTTSDVRTWPRYGISTRNICVKGSLLVGSPTTKGKLTNDLVTVPVIDEIVCSRSRSHPDEHTSGTIFVELRGLVTTMPPLTFSQTSSSRPRLKT